MARLITAEEWRGQLNTNEETAEEIVRLVTKLNTEVNMGLLVGLPGQLAPAIPDLWQDAISMLTDALGIRINGLVICRLDQYLRTLQTREVHYASGGNLKYAVEGCQSLSNLFLLIDTFPLEQLDAFRYLFRESIGDRITTAMKLTLEPVFDQKTSGMIIAGFETTVERYVELLLTNARKEATAVLPIIDLFCKGNWPVCLFPEQKRFLVLVA